MSEVRVVDLNELGVNKEVFDKIYSMGEQDGRADAIIELLNKINEEVDEWWSLEEDDVNWYTSIKMLLEQLKEQNK